MSAISIKNLTKIYKRRHLTKTFKTVGVKNLSLDIKRGEIFSIIGPNGSGKTTTIKLILGFIKPNEGEVYILGNKQNKDILKKIGYIPEFISFPYFLTVTEILYFYSKLTGNLQSKDRINEILEMVELREHRNKQVNELSKGMIQRLGIAQAVLHDPEILIFDEPVSGLDPVGIKYMRNFILSLKEKGKTIFFSSHLISEVEKVSDRVGIISNGELKKIVKQNEWKEHSGRLEEIFIETVQC